MTDKEMAYEWLMEQFGGPIYAEVVSTQMADTLLAKVRAEERGDSCPECKGARFYCYKDIDDLGERLAVRNCQTCNEPANEFPPMVIDRRSRGDA